MINAEKKRLTTVVNAKLWSYGLFSIFVFLAFLYQNFAYATTYNLPADVGRAATPFSSCSLSSGTNYNCSSAISLGNNDIVNVTSSITLNIIGQSFSTGTQVTINSISGGVLTITATEDMNIGSNFTATVNLTAIGKTINFSTNLNLTGNVNAGNTGTLTFQGNSTDSNINGTCISSSTTTAQCSNPTLVINNVSLTEGNSGGTNMTFTVTMSKSINSSVSVNYTTSNASGTGAANGGASCSTAGVDYVTKSGTATITAGSTSTQITAVICGDTSVEPNETFTVTLSNPSSGTFLSLPSYGTGTIVNDDGVSLHHIEIQHGSGTGLTCAANTLTIKACQDSLSPCTAYSGGVSGTLTATGTPAIVWDGTTGGATGTGFVIPSGSSTVTKNVQIPTAGTVLFGSALAGTTCNFGSPACTFTVNTSGFLFSNTTTGTAYTIPAQVSGISTGTLYLRALQASTTNPATICLPAVIGQTIPVYMSYTCNNPAICQVGNLATINSTPISNSAAAVSLSFDSNASAPITIRYDDVGQMTLNASITLTPFSGATTITLTGSSNAFVVAPHHFGFSGVTASPIKAGNNFSATVTAYNGLGTPTVTPNFGKETAPESVVLSFSKYQPTGTSASNGSFSGNAGSFTNGVATSSNLNWSEIGTIDLAATLTSGSYLGSGLTATGNTGTTGALRFIPDHFTTTVTQGCNVGGFTYSAQPFTVTVTAKNGLATPTTTVNYDGSVNTSPNFSKLVTLSESNSVAGSLAPTSVTATAFTAGIANAIPTFSFTTTPTAPATIKLRAVDTDNVSSTGTEGTANIRSGRLQFSNAYGSELQNLALALTAQYWNGTSWITNVADSCTTIAASNFAFVSPVASNNNLTACETAVVVTGSAPAFTATLSKPGNNNNGWVDLTLNLATASGNQCTLVGGVGAAATSAATPWLQYNWRGTGNTNPTARATFGVYKGNKKQIYFRELY